jgi:hypothetical protein
VIQEGAGSPDYYLPDLQIGLRSTTFKQSSLSVPRALLWTQNNTVPKHEQPCQDSEINSSSLDQQPPSRKNKNWRAWLIGRHGRPNQPCLHLNRVQVEVPTNQSFPNIRIFEYYRDHSVRLEPHPMLRELLKVLTL